MDIKLSIVDKAKINHEISIIEDMIRELKEDILQNISMTPEVLNQFSKDKDIIIDKLNNLENEVAIRTKSAIKDYFNNQWR